MKDTKFLLPRSKRNSNNPKLLWMTLVSCYIRIQTQVLSKALEPPRSTHSLVLLAPAGCPSEKGDRNSGLQSTILSTGRKKGEMLPPSLSRPLWCNWNQNTSSGLLWENNLRGGAGSEPLLRVAPHRAQKQSQQRQRGTHPSSHSWLTVDPKRRSVRTTTLPFFGVSG